MLSPMGFYTNSLYLLWVITNCILTAVRCTEITPVFSKEKNGLQQQNNFGYRVELFGRCSVPCGRGLQTAVFVCYDKTTSLKVSRSHCRHLPSPGIYKRVCNSKPCLYRWKKGTWNGCSKSCGQGIIRRRIDCVDKHSKRVSDWKCAHFVVPQRKRKCSVVDCPPEFSVGDWSKCSTSCGEGTRDRPVICKQYLANGTTLRLPHSNCTGMSPAKSIRCKAYTACKSKRSKRRHDGSIQGDGPIDQEEDYDASDASGSGGGEGKGGGEGGGGKIPVKGGTPKILLSKQKTHTHKDRARTLDAVVGSRVWAIKGSRISVTCKAKGDPRPTITWSRDGYEVTEYFEDDVGIDDSGNLLIRKTDRFNEGVYVCKARNKVGVSTATFTLTVLIENKPNIVSEDTTTSFGPGETNVEVTVGGTVSVFTGTTLKIKCPVLGKPTPVVFWFGNGRPISVGKARTIGNNLVIDNIDKIYALKYSCNARNRFGRTSAVTVVKVLDLLPPKIAAEIKSIDAPQSSRAITITVGTNITLIAGVTLTIRCPIESKPIPFMSWTALGRSITGPIGTLTLANDKSSMSIKQMKVANTGLYGCSAENAAGKDSQTSYIRIVPPVKPTIKSSKGFRSSLEKDRTLIVTIGEQATGLVGIAVNIICPVTGLPTPTITWLINRKKLRSFDRRYSMKGTMLVIKKLSKNENGAVTCAARNPVGSAVSSSKVNVITGQKPKIASKSGRITGIHGVESVSVTIGQELRVVQGFIFRLQCPVTGFPTPRVTWSRNDNDVQSSERILIDKNNNDLIINGIKKEDTGQYTCTAVNPVGEARESSYVSIIDEKSVTIEFGNAKVDTSESLKPVTITIGDTLTVLSGTDVTIKCPVKGIPPPYVLWRRKGERIESGDRKGQFRILSGNKVLKIFQVNQEVSGPYECIATNLGGADRVASTINVVASLKPEIDIVSARQEELKDLSMVKSTIGKSIIMLAGAALSLRCPAKGVPRPSFIWSLRNRVIKSGRRVSMVEDTLIVNQTQKRDSGRIFCTAKNTVGQDKRFSDLKVLVPKKPKIQGRPRNQEVQKPVLLSTEVGSSIKIVEGGSVHLTCNAEGLPKPKIQWKFGEIVVTGELLKLPKLNPGDSKKYTCEAVNLVGIDRKVTSLQVAAIHKPVIVSSKESLTVLNDVKPITAAVGQSVTVIQGSVVTLVCHVTGYPLPRITWAKDTIAIQNLRKRRGYSGKRLNVTHYVLTMNTRIRSTEFSGKYECIATNLGGTKVAATKFVVKVPSRPFIESTLVTGSQGIVKQLSSRDPVVLTIGDSAQLLTRTALTILCPTKGLPTPRVEWYAGRKKISQGGKYSLGRGTDLMIGSERFPTTTYDSMRYTCRASNLKGRDMSYSTVRFTEPKAPKILSVSGQFNFPTNTTVNLIIGSTVTAITGSSITLVCESSGLPDPEITWAKNDVVLKANGSRLTIRDAKKSDSGAYECTASNLAGSRTVQSVVNIDDIKEKTEKPKIFKSNHSLIASENKLSFTIVVGGNITILEGKNLVLQCPSYGIPKPVITWMYNNIPVEESDTLIVDSDSGAIKIIEMTREETGKYQCLSKNIAGEDIAITYAIVVGPKKPVIKRTQNVYFRLDPQKRPIRINIGDKLTTFIGTTVTINCPSTGFPDPRIRWNQNDISLTPQISIFLNGTMLILTNPQVSDTGKYTCLASNPGGSENASSNVTFLTPQPPNITTAAKNVEFLARGMVTIRIGSNLKVLAGSSIKLLCETTGVPKPLLSWSKDGRSLRYSRTVLRVNSIKSWDSGRVSCIAKNHFGTDRASSKITVIDGQRPYIAYSRKPITSVSDVSRISTDVGASIRLLERSNVTLFCRASGIPKAVYSWSQNNKLIKNNKRVYFNKTTGVLRMNSINLKDSGTLKCTATNVIGRNQRASSLQVVAIKNPVIGTSSRTINTTTTKTISAQIGDSIATLVNTTITINCPVTAGFPTPVISWFHNGKPVNRRRVRIRGTKLTIMKPKMSDEGSFSCIASNPGGRVTAKSSILLDAGREPSIVTSDDVISDRTGIPQVIATIGSPISILSGTGLKLFCPAKGLPLPTVTWQVAGRRITSVRGRVLIDNLNNAVTINKLGKRDSNRIITCTARNALGITRASSKITVIDTIAPIITTSKEKFVQMNSQKPVSLPIGSTIRILSGTSVSLRCQARGLPKPEVTWTLANIPVTSDVQVTFDNDTLRMAKMGKEDGGTYTCKAVSPLGMATARSTIVVEELTGPFIAQSARVFNTIESVKPIEIQIGANLTALSTTNITIDCTATGIPVPVTSWIKDGGIIKNDHVTVKGSKLRITGSRFADGGVYACKARSLAGNVVVTSHITVIAGQKPIISSSDEVESALKGFTNLTTTIGSSVSILSGSGIRLLCPVKGVPKPIVTWRIDSKSKISRHRLVIDRILHSLSVPRLVSDDYGSYICIARNILGQTSASSAVNVIEPFSPKIDSSKQSIVVLKVQVPAKIRVGAKVRILSGVTLTLLCKAVGLPLPNITWTLDEKPLESSGHVTVKGESLEIVNSGADDSGRYVCTASSAMGQDTAATILTVQSGKKARITTAGRKISLLTGLVNSTAYIGDNITILQSSELSLLCPTEGIPEPKVSWLVKGRPFASSKRIIFNSETKTLTIKNLKIEDSGVLTCVAKNVRGEDRKNTVVNVLVPFGPTMKKSDKAIDGLKSKTPIEVQIGSSVKALINATIVIKCEVSGLPIPKVFWTKDGESLTSKDHVTVKRDELKIDKALLSDQGVYGCTAHSDVGSVSGTSKITVKEPIPPSIKSSNNSIDSLTRKPVGIVIGETVRTLTRIDFNITCEVEGLPQPEIVWKKNGVELLADGRTLINGPIIYVTGSLTTDTGYYVCEAKNVAGKKAVVSKLNIKEPITPQITTIDERKLYDLHPVTITTEVGTFIKTLETSNITLTCAASGFPSPVISWKKGVTTLETHGNMTYTISNAKVDDSGIYTCTASNIKGFDFRTSNVTIVAPTVPVIQTAAKDLIVLRLETLKNNVGKSIVTLSGNTIQITCNATGVPSPSLQWYKGNDKIENTANRLEIKSANTGDSAIYTCVTKNLAGMTKASTNLTILEGKPPIINTANKTISQTLQIGYIVAKVGGVINTLLSSNVEIMCEVSGFPKPKVTWYKEDFEVVQDPNTMVNKKGTLMFVSLALRKAGIYKCVATNSLGSTSASTTLNIKGLKHPYINSSRGAIKNLKTWQPQKIQIGQDLTVLSNVNVSIACPSGGIPIPELEWKKEKTVLESGGRFRVGPKELSIGNVVKEDSALYVCLVRNMMGQISHGSNLKVLDPQKPTISAKFQEIKITQREPVQASIGSKVTTIPGNKLTLTCNVSGLPEPTIMWKRNELMAQQGGSTYVVPELRTSDTGVYTCVASSVIGQVTATSHIIVLVGSMPEIVTTKTNVIATKGENEVTVDIGGNVTTIVGTGVEISCNVKGVPHPSITWIQNGAPIKFTSVRVMNKKSKSLVLLGVRLDDIGFYTCFANNTFGQVSETTHINAFAAKRPVILFSKRQIEDYDDVIFDITIGDSLTTLIGSTVNFKCSATGNPPPQITWTKSGSPLRKTNRMKAVNGTLNILSATWSDTGQYECTAVNAGGSDTKTSFVKFIPPEKPVIYLNQSVLESYQRKPVSMVIGSTLKTLTQTPITINCTASGIPTPSYSWTKKGSPIESSHNLEISEEGKRLTLRNVTLDDAGIYGCTASNKAGQQTAIAPILLLEPILPNIKSTDENITWYNRESLSARVGGKIIALTGTQITLTCQARGFPEPTVSWRKDDDANALETDGQYRVTNRSLVIFAAQPSDSGRYRCVAKNLAGNVQSKTNLKVIDSEEPVIMISNKLIRTKDRLPVMATIGNRIIVLAGTPVSIKCPVKGIPKPKVTWTTGGRFLTKLTNKNSTLELGVTNVNSSGEYACTALNAIGVDAATSKLLVAEAVKPSIPKTGRPQMIGVSNKTQVTVSVPDNITVFSGTTVNIKCPAIGLPKPKITWIKDGKTLQTALNNTLVVKPSVKSDGGTFTCVAENSEGTVRGSSSVNVVEPLYPQIKSKSGVIDALDKPQTTDATIGMKIKTLTMTSVILKCPATGTPSPTITWSKSGDLIESGKRIIVTEDGNLMIQKGRSSDSGNYMCIAQSVLGKDTAVSAIIFFNPTRPEIIRSTDYVIWYENLPFKSKIGNNLTTMKGRKLLLICPARGMPRPEITWYRGGEKMRNEENYVIKGDTLIIWDLSVFDTDRYTCVATNYVGSDAATSTLKVHDPVVPHIFTSSGFIDALSGYNPVNVTVGQDVIAPVSSQVKLICPYKGVPRPKILWIKDHQTVVSDETIEVDCNGTLKFHGIRAKDAGEFVCYVESFLGMDMALTHIKLVERTIPVIEKSSNVIPLGDKSRVTAMIGDNMTALQTHTIEIKCNATGIPYPVITWTRNGLEIDSVGMYSIDKKGTLTITGAGRDGVYVCTAKNDQGIDSATTQITIKEPKRPEIVSPRDPRNIPFTHHKNVTINVRDNLTALPTSSITIRCHATGVPDPVVTWNKDGNATRPGILIHSDGSLFIQDASEADTGRYTCKAENIRGSTTASSNITIMKPTEPVIDRPIEPRDIPAADVDHVILSVGENVTSLVGTKLLIDCDVDGDPKPFVTWTRDNLEIKGQDGFRVLENGTLEIAKASVDDAGKYVCTARNDGGEDREDAIVRVIVPQKPKISIPAKPTTTTKTNRSPVAMSINDNVTVLTNTPISIDCTVSGIPAPTITWMKDGQVLSVASGHVIHSNGTLVIEKADLDDKGRYTCTAKNLEGEDSATSNVNVIDPIAPRIDRPGKPRTIPPKPVGHINSTIGDNITVVTGSNLTINCPAIGSPKPRLMWSKDGQMISQGNKYFVLDNGALVIRKVSVDGSGTYRCTVENIAGNNTAVTRVLALVPKKPQITRPQKPSTVTRKDRRPIKVHVGTNVTSLTNTPITINCSASGLPVPRIKWTKNGKVLDANDGYKINADGSLSIKNAMVQDSGQYTCEVENVEGQDKASSTIKVIDSQRPRISKPKTPRNMVPEDYTPVNMTISDNVTALTNTPITIDCAVSGIPAPTITWMKDGQALSVASGHVIHSNGTLVIEKADLDDKGRYTCIAKNLGGEDSATSNIFVNVPKKPQITRPQKPSTVTPKDRRPIKVHVGTTVTSLTNTPITINCSASGLPAPRIKWTKNGKVLDANDGYKINADGSLSIENAMVQDSGRYTCEAENVEGQDKETSTIKVIGSQRPRISKPKTPRNMVPEDYTPVAMTISDNVTTLTNTPISIDCTVSGIPAPTITWMKDGQELSVASGHVIHSNGTLVIEKADLDDKGRYTCTAKNLEGEDSATSHIFVIVPVAPRIDRPDKPRTIPPRKAGPVDSTIGDDITAVTFANLTIKCPSIGSPKPRLMWSKDGQMISQGNKYSVLDSGALVIRKVSVDESGTYRCTVENIAGKDSGDTKLNVIVPQKPKISTPDKPTTTTNTDRSPVAMTISDNVTTLTNTPISIDCAVSGIPAPTITWMKDGQVLSVASGHVIHGNGTLVIEKADLDDKGRYTCTAKNLEGEDSATSNVNVIVPEIPKIKTRDISLTIVPVNKAPLDLVIGDKATALTDTSVSIHCEVVATPKAKITWSKDTTLLKSDRRYTIFGNGTLLIKKVEITSRGRYSCTARNLVGAVGKTSLVDAIDPQIPQINKPSIPRIITKDDRTAAHATITDTVRAFTRTAITISCTSSGIPVPKVSWSNGGAKLTTGDRYTLYSNGTLLIRNATKLDEGKYTCTAKNIEGEDRESTDVAITVPVKPTIIRVTPENIPIGDGGPKVLNVGSNVSSISYEFVQIKCQARGVPAPQIAWYKRDRLVNARLDRARILGEGTLGLYALTLAQAGVYTCKATNVEGEDSVDSALTVVLRKRPKIIRPKEPQNFIVQLEPSKKLTITDNITTKPGKTISITCMSRGVPKPRITWAKDSDVIKPSSDISIDANGTLTLRNVQEDQSGKYTCTARSRIGADRAASEVLILPLAKPSIEKPQVAQLFSTKDLKPYVLAVGNTLNTFPGTPLTIKCRVRGVPKPNVAWFKDGKPVKSRYPVNQEGSLILGRAKKEDSGGYRCQATNLIGKDSADTSIDVLSPVRPSITKPQMEFVEVLEIDQDIDADIGSEIITLRENNILINCKASGLPQPEISWTKDLVPVNLEDYQVLKNNSLVIQSAQPEDTAIYTCTARNFFGSIEAHSKVEIMDPEIPVIQRTDGSVEMDGFNEIKVDIGKHVSSLSRVNITVNCSARGVPPPNIEWMNGGKPLNVKGSMLILNNVDRSISGKYTCVASNVVGKTSAYSMINITEPSKPIIHQTKAELVINKVTSISTNIGGSIEILISSNLLLLCNATGHPIPQVKWFKSGVPLSSSHRYVVSGRSLRIFGVKKNDSAEYSCSAANVVGRVIATSELTVKGFQSPKIKVVKKQIKNFDKKQPIQVAVGTSLITSPNTTVVISCPVTALPTAKLSWQLAGVPIVPSAKYRMNRDKSKLMISNVGFKDVGAYVCTAFNRAGTDFAAMELSVATPPLITNIRGSFDVTDIRELISITTGAVVTIPRGVAIRIKCETKGIPTPNITWFRVPEGSIVRQPIGFDKKHVFIDKDGFLSIDRTKEIDIAKYICVATNIAGRDEGVTHLSVGAAPDLPGHWSAARKFIKPRIERIESMATVVRGSTVRLRCAVYGSPKPNVTWIVVGNERKDHWVMYADGSLEIPKVDFSDEGNYTCIASNIYGRTYRSTNVTVLVPPQILDMFFSESFIKEKAQLLHLKYSSITRLSIKRDQTTPAAVERGGNLVIGCPVKGKPEPSILWLRDGLKVRNDSKHLILGGLLLIRKISPGDAGEYFCFVKNTAGEDGGGIDLHVRKKIVGRWLPGPWSECENCYLNFKGYKTRSISCIDDKKNIVPESFCSELPRPLTKQQCRARSCEAIWVTKKWSSCSALCGGKGVRKRVVNCLFYKSLLPANGHCTGVKPSDTEPCNRAPCGKRICKDFVAYCRQIKLQGLCKAYKPWCCQTCNGEAGGGPPIPK